MTQRSLRKRRARRGPHLVLGFALVAILVAIAVWAVQSRARSQLGSITDADPSNAELVELGRQIYSIHCASCHGANLEGQPGWQQPDASGIMPAPPLDASGPAPQRSNAELYAIIAQGAQAEVEPRVSSAMPAYTSLTAERIWAVVSYLQSEWTE